MQSQYVEEDKKKYSTTTTSPYFHMHSILDPIFICLFQWNVRAQKPTTFAEKLWRWYRSLPCGIS